MHPLLLVVFGVGTTLVATNPTTATCPSSTLDDAKKGGSALADLSVDFYKLISSANQDRNAVVSPVSLALALALLESGSAGRTRDKLRQVLTGSESETEALLSYQALQKHLSLSDEKTKLSIANGLFPHKDLTVKNDYLSTVKNCFGSDIEKVDFRSHLEESRQKINKWVSDKTSAKIPELFKAGVLNPDVALVLANAIYFKSAWNNAFNVADTKPGNFYRYGREQDVQQVQFMTQTGHFGYFSDNTLEALEINYSGRDLAMYIILPKAKDGLRTLEQGLTGEKLESIATQADSNWISVRASIPKFSIRTAVDLADVLRRLDLGIIFSDNADFGRMSDAALKVSKAVHEAYINVNENGTEAAAATGFSIKFRSSPPRNPQQFTADHPFMYAIKHKPTGAVLFLGKVNHVENEN